ncbi:hypothetical protein ABFS83_02G121900 [Erythranthe nasuta]
MKLHIQFQALFLFVGVLVNSVGAYIGVNIGTDVTNLPPPVEIVAILRAHQITHVRLFDSDARILNALSATGILVHVSVTNQEVLGIGESTSAAATWISKNIAAYLPSTNITAISVGSEVLTSLPNAAPILFSAMSNLHKALVASNLNDRVKISTPFAMDVIPNPFPPSTANFNSTFNTTIFQILQFLKNTKSFYMVNAYPYYEYVKSNGIFPLEYALFKPLSSVKQIVDPNTLFHYDNMYDALIDAVYNSIAALNFSGIPVVVTETGWPWFGGATEPDATLGNAETYINNLIRRVANESGPPSQRSFPIHTYIYELFNEDKRGGDVSERSWGLVFANGSTVYDLSLSDGSEDDVNGSVSVFCIAKQGADESGLRDGINWACGPGRANCGPVQEGRACYMPDTLQNHASFAYNDYYQKMRGAGGTCDFGGTAVITSVDPSYGSCRFTGSSYSSTSGPFPSPAFGPVGPSSGSSRNVDIFCFGILFAANALLYLLGVNCRYIL